MEENRESYGQYAEERICRICLDSGECPTLLSPCTCTGSVKYVHEQCLKTWICSKTTTIGEPQCEICHLTYRMKVVMRYKCICCESLRENIQQWITVPLFLVIEGFILAMVYFLYEELSTPTPTVIYVFSLILMVICCVSFAIFSVLLYLAFKYTCCSQTVKYWVIYNSAHHEVGNEGVDSTFLYDKSFSEKNEYAQGKELSISPVNLLRGEEEMKELSENDSH